MVPFVGLLHPCRAQDRYLGHLPQIIADKHPADAIIEQLLLHRENLRVQIEMIYKLLKTLLIHMDMQFLFQLSLIAIKSLRCVFFKALVLLDQLFNNGLGLTFSLHKSKNMVDVVGHDVSFLCKGVRLCFFALRILKLGFRGCDIYLGL